ncbi:MAG: cyclic nucleotide-binding domain-containing protein [Turneriella sp.]|nr:cyclic nucleotide-binding domain-containing protein [Turneriella sp.]
MYWVDSIDSQIYPKGAKIFSAGEPDEGQIYYLLTGKLQLIRPNSGAPVVIKLITPHNFFGEMAAITGHQRTIDAIVASDEARIAVLPKQSFLLLATSKPEGLLDLCRSANDRYLIALQKIAEMQSEKQVSRDVRWQINEADPAAQLDLEQFVRGLPSLEFFKLQVIYDNLQAYPRGIYWIKSGAVELTIESRKNSLVNLDLSEGDIFGAISLLDSDVSVSVKAVSMADRTMLNYLDKDGLLYLSRKNPLLSYALLRLLLLRAERIENLIPTD